MKIFSRISPAHLPLILGVFFLISLFPVSRLLLKQTDTEMRNELLMQARIASKAIDLSWMGKLSGSDEDLSLTAYHRLKETMASIRSTNPNYRFAYVMGRNDTDAVFFYADSEPESSQDYSPPGQIYQQASRRLKAVFDGEGGFVEGPLEDDWGIWVSAVAPIVDPRTGKIEALFGVDVDASLWNVVVWSKTAPAIGFMLLILLCVVLAFRLMTTRSCQMEGL